MAAQQKYHEQFKGALHSMIQDLAQVKSSFEEVKHEMVEMKCAIKEVQKTVNQVLSYLPLLPKTTLPSDSSSLHHQAESSASKCFQLRFRGKLPDTLLTKNNIEDESALTVELCDDTGKRLEVNQALCLKNMKVKFLVLDGDFDIKDRDDWTEGDFKMNVATPRKDKAPLLKGNCEVSLKEGAARVCGISFTDNSRSTTKNGSFRLGAQITRGLPSGWVVKPAVSEAFQVKESRLKSDLKHAIPSPTDELYRLKNINRTGTVYRRAVSHKVVTVMDFLQLYHTDPKEMQKILQVTGIKWEETVKNAKACNLTSESYKFEYHDDATGDFLLLNCDFNIESVTFMGQTSQPYESLEVSQKEKVDNIRKAAYKKRKELRKVYDSTSQSLVQAGFSRLTYLSSFQQQEQEQQQSTRTPTPTFNINSEVPNLVGFSDLICSYPCTNPYLATTSTYQDNCGQNFMNIPASSTTDAYGVHETHMAVENDSSAAYNYLTEQVVDNRLDSQQFSDITATKQGEMDMQPIVHNSSANMMATQSFSDTGVEKDNVENLSHIVNKWYIEHRWCTVTVVQLGICRWKKRRALRCRPQKKQKN